MSHEDLNRIISMAMEYQRYPREIDGIKIGLGGYNEILNEDAFRLSEEQIQRLEKTWDGVQKHNSVASKHNSGLYKEALKVVQDFFKILNIPIHKTSKWGKITGEYKEYKIFRNYVDKLIPTRCPYSSPRLYNYTLNGETYRSHVSPVSLSGLISQMKRKVEETKVRTNKKNKLVRCAFSHDAYREIDNPDQYSDKEIVAIVNEKAKEQWAEENCPEGTELDFDQCDECSTWVVGEHRCSCGNRRVDLVVEGDILNGFYGYGEAY